MFQLANSVALLLFCASAATAGRRAWHATLIAAALLGDVLIALLLNLRRGVIGRATVEMALPIKALHIGSALLALLLMVACLVLALRRWRRGLAIGPWGILVLAVAITTRMVAYGSSFLMTML